MGHVFVSLMKTHYPGLVTRPKTGEVVPATRWEDYKLRSDTTHGSKYEAVLHDFWVSQQPHFV